MSHSPERRDWKLYHTATGNTIDPEGRMTIRPDRRSDSALNPIGLPL